MRNARPRTEADHYIHPKFWGGTLVALLVTVVAATLATALATAEPEVRYIVRFKSDSAAPNAALLQHNTPSGVTSSTWTLGLSEIAVPEALISEGDSVCNLLREETDVCEIDQPIYLHIHPESALNPLMDQQWALSAIAAQGAWVHSRGAKGISVAVLDTGIDLGHPDLQGNLWRNSGEIPGNGIDDDGNGIIDDIHGINTVERNGHPQDGNGHGTHVSGVIGAVADNQIGISGVAPHVSLIAARCLGDGGAGSLFDAIKAIEYLINLKFAGKVDLVAVNASWGTANYSPAFQEAIKALGKAGIVLVSSAGNNGGSVDQHPTYPAAFALPNVISVAALDANLALAPFSNFHPSRVHIGAPGVGVISSLPGGRYARLSGTSMAAPHVSGTLALLAAVNTQLRGVALRNLLLNAARTGGTLAGKIERGRVLNAERAITSALGLAPPHIPSATSPTPPKEGQEIPLSASLVGSPGSLKITVLTSLQRIVSTKLSYRTRSCYLPSLEVGPDDATTVQVLLPSWMRAKRSKFSTQRKQGILGVTRLTITLEAKNGKRRRLPKRWCAKAQRTVVVNR